MTPRQYCYKIMYWYCETEMFAGFPGVRNPRNIALSVYSMHRIEIADTPCLPTQPATVTFWRYAPCVSIGQVCVCTNAFRVSRCIACSGL